MGTFRILFATQVLNLLRLAKSNYFVTDKKNICGHISNNHGPSHGGYTISGRGSSNNLKTENPGMIGGKESSNSIIFTIDYILKAVEDIILEHSTLSTSTWILLDLL